MDKYICGFNDKVVNIYIPRDNRFVVAEWSINFELIDESIEDLDSTITVFPNEIFTDDIYAVFEYREQFRLGYYSLMIGENDKYSTIGGIEISKEQFSLLKMTIADSNGQQVLKDMYNSLYHSSIYNFI